MFNFANDTPRNPDGSLDYSVQPKVVRRKKGLVFGHFHYTEDKKDPAIWWKQLFGRGKSETIRKVAAVGFGLGAAWGLWKLFSRK
jgi:hypothetical protein